MRCEECGKEYPSKYYFKTESICNECYNKLSPEEKETVAEQSPIIVPETSQLLRYPAFKTIAGIYKVLAILCGIGAGIGVFFGIASLDKYGSRGGGIILSSIIFGAIAVISFLAVSEGIKVIINIEENTRSSTEYLKKLLAK